MRGDLADSAKLSAKLSDVAQGPGVTAVRIATGAHWQEIDRPEDIALWERDHRP